MKWRAHLSVSFTRESLLSADTDRPTVPAELLAQERKSSPANSPDERHSAMYSK
jgi:hypothetical protein